MAEAEQQTGNEDLSDLKAELLRLKGENIDLKAKLAEIQAGREVKAVLKRWKERQTQQPEGGGQRARKQTWKGHSREGEGVLPQQLAVCGHAGLASA